MKTYVLYHANCYDGFGAAWAAWKRLDNKAEYFPVSYGNAPPPMELNSVVYLLDFSYPRDVLLALTEKMYHVTVLDHHKTAEVELAGLGRPAHRFDVEPAFTPPGLYVKFDLEESGASLAWEYFYELPKSGQHWTPELVKYVRDRDLWKFAMPCSREVHAWLRSHPFGFKLWDWLNYCLTDDGQYHVLVAEGKAILRSVDQQIVVMCQYPNWIELGGHRVPCVNATVHFSEVGDYLCQQYPEVPFAAYYLDHNDGKRQWGLRSRGGFDVSAIAKQYGGGGHAAAAGFTTDIPPLLA